MDGIHDLGGMEGFGPIEREADEPVFHHDWERRAFAHEFVIGANLDEGRHAIERLDPVTYLTTSYYERWHLSHEMLLIEKGVLTAEEIEARVAKLKREGG